MNNEEKNIPQDENKPEINNAKAPVSAGKKKLPPSLIGIIVGGFVMLILAIVLMVTLIPGGNGQNDGDGGQAGGNGTSTFIATVVDQNGSPIFGAKVTLTTADGIPFYHTTDIEGKVKLSGNFNGLTATVTSLPVGYESDKLNVAQSFDANGKLTITVNQLPPLVIIIVDQNGEPVEGASVTMCDTTNQCKQPTYTDAEGKAYYPFEEGEFKAQIISLPDGYTGEIGVYSYFSGNEVTIEVTKN